MRIARLPLVPLALLLLAGCGAGHELCHSDTDCPAPETCNMSQGQCFTPLPVVTFMPACLPSYGGTLSIIEKPGKCNSPAPGASVYVQRYPNSAESLQLQTLESCVDNGDGSITLVAEIAPGEQGTVIVSSAGQTPPYDPTGKGAYQAGTAGASAKELGVCMAPEATSSFTPGCQSPDGLINIQIASTSGGLYCATDHSLAATVGGVRAVIPLGSCEVNEAQTQMTFPVEIPISMAAGSYPVVITATGLPTLMPGPVTVPCPTESAAIVPTVTCVVPGSEFKFYITQSTCPVSGADAVTLEGVQATNVTCTPATGGAVEIDATAPSTPDDGSVVMVATLSGDQPVEAVEAVATNCLQGLPPGATLITGCASAGGSISISVENAGACPSAATPTVYIGGAVAQSVNCTETSSTEFTVTASVPSSAPTGSDPVFIDIPGSNSLAAATTLTVPCPQETAFTAALPAGETCLSTGDTLTIEVSGAPCPASPGDIVIGISSFQMAASTCTNQNSGNGAVVTATLPSNAPQGSDSISISFPGNLGPATAGALTVPCAVEAPVLTFAPACASDGDTLTLTLTNASCPAALGDLSATAASGGEATLTVQSCANLNGSMVVEVLFSDGDTSPASMQLNLVVSGVQYAAASPLNVPCPAPVQTVTFSQTCVDWGATVEVNVTNASCPGAGPSGIIVQIGASAPTAPTVQSCANNGDGSVTLEVLVPQDIRSGVVNVKMPGLAFAASADTLQVPCCYPAGFTTSSAGMCCTGENYINSYCCAPLGGNCTGTLIDECCGQGVCSATPGTCCIEIGEPCSKNSDCCQDEMNAGQTYAGAICPAGSCCLPTGARCYQGGSGTAPDATCCSGFCETATQSCQ